MHPLLSRVAQGQEILFAVAAPVEIRAVFRALADAQTAQPHVPALWERVRVRPGVSLVHVGVGKSNAAGGLAISVRPDDAVVLNVGIAGALPVPTAKLPLQGYSCEVGDTITATTCTFGDEGILTPQGYQDVSEIGFPIDPQLGSSFPCHPDLIAAFRSHTTHTGVVTSVSTCSATDALAGEIAHRTGALAETMEGAALALVAHRMKRPFCEVRAISNVTGDRSHQRWEVARALQSLERVVRDVLGG